MSESTFIYSVIVGSFTVIVVSLIYFYYYISKPATQSSILPDVEPKKTAEGYKLIDNSQTVLSSLGFGLVAIVMVLGMGAPIYYFNLPFMPKVLFSLGVIAGIVFLGSAISKFWRAFKLSNPSITLSEWPLSLGETYTIEYERDVPNDIDINGIDAYLVCDEWAKMGSGEQSMTYTNRFHEEELETDEAVTNTGMIHQQWSITVPMDFPQSFDAKRNSITWKIRVELDIDNFPDDHSNFELLLLPEAANVNR